MESREFGRTGLRVSALGLGAGGIGSAEFSEEQAARLLHGALDAGVTLIDTARGYGLSEERIGRHLGSRRAEFVLSTKVGYGIAGQADWTYGCILAGIDEALRRLRTDVLDVVHLHSCPRATLEHGDVLLALERAVEAGKVRVAAYSGENDALDWAVDSGRFGSVEHSLSLCDQRVLEGALPRATARGMGVIAKRPVANAPWRFGDECPRGDYAEEYWWRWRTMQLQPRGMEWQALALRFSAFAPGVASCIVGTSKLEHLQENARILEQGPLAPDLVEEIRRRFRLKDPGWWVGQV